MVIQIYEESFKTQTIHYNEKNESQRNPGLTQLCYIVTEFLQELVVLCCKGSLLQSANVALPGSSTLTVPGSPATGATQNIYMVCIHDALCILYAVQNTALILNGIMSVSMSIKKF